MKKNDNLDWLLNWYSMQCDGDWEHGNSIKIGTLDNPGWYLSVSLRETECEGVEFEPVIVERSEDDWYHCFIKDEKFEGPCGLFNLYEVIQVFREWAESCQKNKTDSVN